RVAPAKEFALLVKIILNQRCINVSQRHINISQPSCDSYARMVLAAAKIKERLLSATITLSNKAEDPISVSTSESRLDKNKEGLGYIAVLLPPTQLYSPPKKDLSWTGLLEFADDTITDYSRPSPTIESNTNDTNRNSSVFETRESPSIITSKPAIKFVNALERSTTDKVETTKKPAVKYVELYRKTTKRSTVRGNQRN
nr:hypothetical protein [Tanacetum cinerariifolium]